MSDTVSALNGATFQGFVTVEDAGLQGMITLRGDLGSAKLLAAVTAATGLVTPSQRKIVSQGDMAVAWMSPDEVLILTPYDQAGTIAATLAQALSGEHGLVQTVSDARTVVRLTGAPGSVREVLAKLAPVDLSPQAFEPGEFRRTRLAQVAGAMWFDDTTSARIICFRSVADYVFKLLCISAEEGGEVDYFN
ncbi:sarcosine oxidase, gamma subunit family [Thalassovita gelatinovora]|uniref:Sarcosine oxidase, gamma subunit family n=1 Tax=Thalassovita gelatinovora TaxID=53501 RepID=A0A0P1F6S0_THAGE|nr:sarcosine oxidase subunit gamma family protein [Thalassovita gelatinovora]QIZ79214.1 sarcosine oxidase subunit gamma [Thalassovita gelatinovora]CUH63710.1 sarcosine oxidase, gamma subunit family [Thalassovita gelatinovora]SER02095.1 sarcosine oxidase subunit gamma [Thalassovita gelatinovora]